MGVGGWGRRELGVGSWGLGKKGIRSWELGVGEEGSWELGVRGWGRRELGVGGWGRREFSNNSTLFSHSEHRYAEASYGTRNFALFSPTSPSPHPPTLFPTQHSALYTQHST
uniref:Uncharacterized protein n=1 Tax=Desertifilum tharense IPPAS B-1220 TaxID=1781255 RepID=A0ACD5H126_9CYAN